MYEILYEETTVVEPKKEGGILIYPLPAVEKLIVEIPDKDVQINEFKVTDINGRLMIAFSMLCGACNIIF
jgi:hypothetical protein